MNNTTHCVTIITDFLNIFDFFLFNIWFIYVAVYIANDGGYYVMNIFVYHLKIDESTFLTRIIFVKPVNFNLIVKIVQISVDHY